MLRLRLSAEYRTAIRGVLAQHHACGELALVGVLFGAPLAVAMRAAVRAAVRAAERNPRARARAEQGRAKRGRKFSSIADRRRSLSVGVAAVATLRCSPPRARPRTPCARARSPHGGEIAVPRLQARARQRPAPCDAVRVRGMEGLIPFRGPEHPRLATSAHVRALGDRGPCSRRS